MLLPAINIYMPPGKISNVRSAKILPVMLHVVDCVDDALSAGLRLRQGERRRQEFYACDRITGETHGIEIVLGNNVEAWS